MAIHDKKLESNNNNRKYGKARKKNERVYTSKKCRSAERYW